MKTDLKKIRNIGISAHIDSGKTTLTERILYYCKKIHKIHEVKGKDGVGATMDSMELEKERGITIASAATNVIWNDHSINIIDTPGHVDFSIEVERSLRVLDGAILVLCSVGGIQSQSITVDRQLKRYKVPSLVFINKCDRTGANPFKVKQNLINKLDRNAVLMQIPIGLEDKYVGVVDLVSMKAIYFEGSEGKEIINQEIPLELKQEAEKKREEMLDGVSLFSDELTEAILDERITDDLIYDAVRKGTVSNCLVPVFMGAAFKNKGVQPLMDAIVRYLPNPAEVENFALDLDSEEKPVKLNPDSHLGCVAFAFKLEEGKYGQLTYIRIYQGSVKKGDELYNTRSGNTFKVNRLVKMHAESMEDINKAECGDIVALFGIDCASGDTFVSPGLNYSMSSIYIPEPVISLAVTPTKKGISDKMSKALNRFVKEDPTFKTYVDPESKQTIVQGMGELHLDVYIERMRREYGVEVETGAPQVAYRETISKKVHFDYTHKKQTGGAGQYGRVIGVIEPNPEVNYEFENKVKGGHIPTEYIPACEEGFKDGMEKGNLIGFPLTGIKVILTDGNFHPVDSSDIAFRSAAKQAFKQSCQKANPIILEPIMKVSIESPSEFAGKLFASINQRRGIIISSVEDGVFARVDAEVPLNEMFGYSTILRSLTQGKAEFTMEFLKYDKVPVSISERLIKEYREK
ncbi:MAG: elongation factor G [Candidatus Aminicenantaceae bacterium]